MAGGLVLESLKFGMLYLELLQKDLQKMNIILIYGKKRKKLQIGF